MSDRLTEESDPHGQLVALSKNFSSTTASTRFVGKLVLHVILASNYHNKLGLVAKLMLTEIAQFFGALIFMRTE